MTALSAIAANAEMRRWSTRAAATQIRTLPRDEGTRRREKKIALYREGFSEGFEPCMKFMPAPAHVRYAIAPPTATTEVVLTAVRAAIAGWITAMPTIGPKKRSRH